MPFAGEFLLASDVPQDAWTVYVPTYTGITIGNAAVVAKYMLVGKLVHARFSLTAGSTTTFSATTLLVSLPVTESSDYITGDPFGPVYMLDSSVGSASRRGGTACRTGSNVFFLDDSIAGGTVTNLVPWTWATGDILAFVLTYEAA